MITSFSIGNFKAFAEKQSIPLKPITLIYGANSSGKSSIIHSLMFAQHAQSTGDFDLYNSSKGGDSIDFGGFQQITHKHNLSNIIELSFSVAPDKGKGHKSSVGISIGIPTDDTGKRLPRAIPEALRYDIIQNDKVVLKISKRKDSLYGIDYIDQSFLKNPISHQITINGQPINFKTTEDDLIAVTKECRLKKHGILPRPIDTATQLLQKIYSVQKVPTKKSELIALTLNAANFALFNQVASIMQPIESEISRFLNAICYLGPLRSYPPRHLVFSKYNDPNWYAGGGYAWDIIRKQQHVRDKINYWLEDPNRLQTPYKLILHDLVSVNQLESALYRELVNINPTDNNADGNQQTLDIHDAELLAKQMMENILRSNIDVSHELVMIDQRSGTYVSHRDIGVGVSQVLPVLGYSYAYKNTMIAIEQPELHLHPAIQSDLGDVFIESALGENKNRMLIETHSEHILMRIMRRIRETNQLGKENVSIPITNDDVLVLFVQPLGERSIVREMRLNEKGELIKTWPEGFFSEFIRDINPFVASKERV